MVPPLALSAFLALLALLPGFQGCAPAQPTSVLSSIPAWRTANTVLQGDYLVTETRLIPVQDPKTGHIEYLPQKKAVGLDGREILVRGLKAAIP